MTEAHDVTEPFNPLKKIHLAESIARALLRRTVEMLPPTEPFSGAGIYALYYAGDFGPYRPIAKLNANDRWRQPIYVGKAVPPGGRKGRFGLEQTAGTALYQRLCQHGKTIQQANNLRLEDFRCRHLVTDDIFITLGERLLITWFAPIWNGAVEGFGLHDPGSRRSPRRSLWDTLHTGRETKFTSVLQKGKRSADEIISDLETFFASWSPRADL